MHLVTALIVDAFTSLGDSQKDFNPIDPGQQTSDASFHAWACLPAWALTYPQRYQLIFGTPIPGYEAPADITLPAAAWALIPLIETLQELYQADKLRVENLAKLTPALKSMLGAWQEFVKELGMEDHIEVLYLAFVIWSRVHGLVTLELGHQAPSFITDPGRNLSA